MLEPTRTRRWRSAIWATASLAFVLFFAWIVREANAGRDNVFFQLVRSTPYGDKIGHVFVASCLTLAANRLCGFRAWRMGGLLWPIGSLAILVVMALEELSQAYYPNRTLDLFDALANLAGIAVATFLLRRRWRAKPTTASD